MAGVGVVVDVVDVGDVDVVVDAVIEETIASPVSAVEAGAEVAEAIVDATVVSDGGPPISGVPKVSAATPTPVSGGPESAGVGGENPGAVDPVVAIVAVGPIAGSPDVAITRAERLGIDRNERRSDANGDEYAGLRSLRSQHERSSDHCRRNHGLEIEIDAAGDV